MSNGVSDEAPGEQQVRALWQQLTAACPLGGDGCPDSAELAAFARGELEGSRRDHLAMLVGNCATCAAGVRVALAADSALTTRPAQASTPAARLPGASVRAEPMAAPVSAPTPLAPSRQSRWVTAMAAALLLVALAGVWLRLPAPPGPGGDEPRRGTDSTGLHPVAGAQVANPVRFDWPTVAADGSCRVQLRDRSGAMVFESSAVDRGGVSTPQPLGAGRYQWSLLCDGAAPRGPHAFTVQP